MQAQTHTPVSLENQIYYILEQAQQRGLCEALPGARPYTKKAVLSAINEILNADAGYKNPITVQERKILENYRDNLAKPKTGIDLFRGGYFNETNMGKNDFPLSVNVEAGIDTEFSGGMYSTGDSFSYGADIWAQALLSGDIGKNVSYGFLAEGGLIRQPRDSLGNYNTYYPGFPSVPGDEFENRLISTYSEPLTHFPYSYRKRWDGSIFPLTNLSSFEPWPNGISGGYALLSELTGSFMEDRILLRLGRMTHDWGVVPKGSSLALNQNARPFIGLEASFKPLSWFSISTLNGILEYYNTEGIKDSAQDFQNAVSLSMLQFNYKNYFYFDLGEGVIYPKRFELGYISPITNTIFYQNNIGDFDNMSMFFNIKGQYPGLGNIWFSLFWDEAYWVLDAYELDRTMLAYQAGTSISLPFLAFSSLKITYSKINPYTYTHNRNYNPWYPHENGPMITSYTNNGVGLGYYLPPNADEILLRFETMPAPRTTAHLQYQMIRHGADYGTSAVDGSSLFSELDPDGRGTNPTLRRYFLQDGAYQWFHILKIGAGHTFAVRNATPFRIFGEAGVVLSYFTDIDGMANSGSPSAYHQIDTSQYPRSTGFILTLGFSIFPK
jgi:hypothetical protein